MTKWLSIHLFSYFILLSIYCHCAAYPQKEIQNGTIPSDNTSKLQKYASYKLLRHEEGERLVFSGNMSNLRVKAKWHPKPKPKPKQKPKPKPKPKPQPKPKPKPNPKKVVKATHKNMAQIKTTKKNMHTTRRIITHKVVHATTTRRPTPKLQYQHKPTSPKHHLTTSTHTTKPTPKAEVHLQSSQTTTVKQEDEPIVIAQDNSENTEPHLPVTLQPKIAVLSNSEIHASNIEESTAILIKPDKAMTTAEVDFETNAEKVPLFDIPKKDSYNNEQSLATPKQAENASNSVNIANNTQIYTINTDNLLLTPKPPKDSAPIANDNFDTNIQSFTTITLQNEIITTNENDKNITDILMTVPNVTNTFIDTAEVYLQSSKQTTLKQDEEPMAKNNLKKTEPPNHDNSDNIRNDTQIYTNNTENLLLTPKPPEELAPMADDHFNTQSLTTTNLQNVFITTYEIDKNNTDIFMTVPNVTNTSTDTVEVYLQNLKPTLNQEEGPFITSKDNSNNTKLLPLSTLEPKVGVIDKPVINSINIKQPTTISTKQEKAITTVEVDFENDAEKGILSDIPENNTNSSEPFFAIPKQSDTLSISDSIRNDTPIYTNNTNIFPLIPITATSNTAVVYLDSNNTTPDISEQTENFTNTVKVHVDTNELAPESSKQNEILTDHSNVFLNNNETTPETTKQSDNSSESIYVYSESNESTLITPKQIVYSNANHDFYLHNNKSMPETPKTVDKATDTDDIYSENNEQTLETLKQIDDIIDFDAVYSNSTEPTLKRPKYVSNLTDTENNEQSPAGIYSGSKNLSTAIPKQSENSTKPADIYSDSNEQTSETGKQTHGTIVFNDLYSVSSEQISNTKQADISTNIFEEYSEYTEKYFMPPIPQNVEMQQKMANINISSNLYKLTDKPDNFLLNTEKLPTVHKLEVETSVTINFNTNLTDKPLTTPKIELEWNDTLGLHINNSKSRPTITEQAKKITNTSDLQTDGNELTPETPKLSDNSSDPDDVYYSSSEQIPETAKESAITSDFEDVYSVSSEELPNPKQEDNSTDIDNDTSVNIYENFNTTSQKIVEIQPKLANLNLLADTDTSKEHFNISEELSKTKKQTNNTTYATEVYYGNMSAVITPNNLFTLKEVNTEKLPAVEKVEVETNIKNNVSTNLTDIFLSKQKIESELTNSFDYHLNSSETLSTTNKQANNSIVTTEFFSNSFEPTQETRKLSENSTEMISTEVYSKSNKTTPGIAKETDNIYDFDDFYPVSGEEIQNKKQSAIDEDNSEIQKVKVQPKMADLNLPMQTVSSEEHSNIFETLSTTTDLNYDYSDGNEQIVETSKEIQDTTKFDDVYSVSSEEIPNQKQANNSTGIGFNESKDDQNFKTKTKNISENLSTTSKQVNMSINASELYSNSFISTQETPKLIDNSTDSAYVYSNEIEHNLEAVEETDDTTDFNDVYLVSSEQSSNTKQTDNSTVITKDYAEDINQNFKIPLQQTIGTNMSDLNISSNVYKPTYTPIILLENTKIHPVVQQLELETNITNYIPTKFTDMPLSTPTINSYEYDLKNSGPLSTTTKQGNNTIYTTEVYYGYMAEVSTRDNLFTLKIVNDSFAGLNVTFGDTTSAQEIKGSQTNQINSEKKETSLTVPKLKIKSEITAVSNTNNIDTVLITTEKDNTAILLNNTQQQQKNNTNATAGFDSDSTQPTLDTLEQRDAFINTNENKIKNMQPKMANLNLPFFNAYSQNTTLQPKTKTSISPGTILRIWSLLAQWGD